MLQFCSVTRLFLTLCYHMNHSTPGLPVHHQLPEFTQTDIHGVGYAYSCHPTIMGYAIPPSHPLSSPSAPALKLTQHQGLFQWVGFSQLMGAILEYQLQISPSKEHIGLIFWMDWLDLLAVQGKWFRGIEIKNA